MSLSSLSKYKNALAYGVSLALLLLLLKWTEWHFLIIHHSFEIYAGMMALLFTGLGIWLATTLTTPKIKTVLMNRAGQPNGHFVLNEAEKNRLRLSTRELEVLQLMADGLTNPKIAEKLFVSVNTIKTHSSNLFLKLEVERRTQAINKGKRLSLIS